MNRTTRMRVLATVLTLVSVIVIAGCASKPSTQTPAPVQGPAPSGTAAPSLKGTPIDIGTLYAEGTSGYKWTRNLADQLERDVPGTKVSMVFVNTAARPALDQRWRAGNPPDIDYNVFMGPFPETYELVDKGLLLDLTPYMQEKLPGTDTKWIDAIQPVVRNYITDPRDGKIYGVPSEITVFVIFYNEKIFTENNLKPPTTWSELIQVGEALKAKGIAPFALAGGTTYYQQLWYDHLVQRECGTDMVMDALHGRKGSVKDDPCFLKAAQKLQDIKDRGFFQKGWEGRDFTSSQIEFFQSKAAMILVGTWLIAEMKDSIPAGFKVGLTAFPAVEGGKGQQTALFGTLNFMVVAKNGKNPQLAIEFLKRWSTVENQTNRVKELNQTSAIKGVPSPEALPGVSKLIDAAAVSGGLTVRYMAMEKKKNLWDLYAGEVSKLLLGKQDAAGFLDSLDRQLTAFHKK